MTLNQLKYFVAVCKYGSFANAAAALFVSQPAIAQSIRDLESEYNVRLFDRNNNRIALTEDGKWLLGESEKIIKRVSEISKELAARSKNKRTVKLGIVPMAGNIYFYSVINKMRSDIPSIIVDIQEAGSLEIKKWLEINQIDMALCILDCLSSDKIKSEKIMDAEIQFYVHKTHNLASRKSISFADLRGERICMLREDSFQNILLKQKFAEANVPLDVMMYSSQLNSILTMLSYGNCGAFLFAGAAKNLHDLVAIPMDPPIHVQLGIAWNSQQQDYPATNEARKYIITNSNNN